MAPHNCISKVEWSVLSNAETKISFLTTTALHFIKISVYIFSL